MSLLNKASLIQIPSGYKDGTLYSAKPTNGDGDFTFSRGSNLAATRVNSDGLIEKGRENLLLQSNQFNTTWSLENLSVTSGQSGYDGSSDAWKVTPTIDDTYHRLTNAVSGAANSVVTLSVYAKADGYNFIRVSENGTTGDYATFNLSTGIVENNTSLDAKIESIGSGWYRCSSTIIPAATHRFDIYVMETATVQQPWDGDGVSGILIQSAQLEVGLISTPYIETGASTAQAGILEDMPRLDYSGGASCGSLLLEPQRTNLIDDYSGYTWDEFNGASIAFNGNQQSPEGLDNAVTWTFSGTSGEVVQRSSITISNSTTYTISGYFKLTSGTLSSGSNQLKGLDGLAGANVSLNTLTSEWQRLSFDVTSSSTTGRVQFRCDDSATIQVYGLQLEAGSHVSSIIPTYGASVTRGADSCTNADVSSLLGSGVGTAFIDMVVNGQDTQGNIPLTIGTGTSNLIYLWIQTSRTIRYEAYTGGTLEGAVNTASGFYTYGDRIKVALVWADNDFAMYINGTQIGTDTSGTAPTPTKLWLGEYTGGNYKGGSINQVLLFPTRLSNDELATLTTL